MITGMRIIPVLCLSLLAVGEAKAASTTLALNLTTGVGTSTSITCTAVTPAPQVPVAPGTNVATCVVAPTNWVGSISLTGAPLNMFVPSVSGVNVNINVGSSPVTVAKIYNLTVTSTP